MMNSSWPLFKLGLNPYGMTYYLGLQGRGTTRQNPNGTGLEGFLKIAEELGAKSLEIFDPWLHEFSGNDFQSLKARLDRQGIIPVISGGFILEETGHVFKSARLLKAKTIRFALTDVLCGGRAFRTEWNKLRQAVRRKILEFGKTTDDAGLIIAIENHQDFTSAELVEFCEMTPGVGITYDTGNSFPVAESPDQFTKTVAPYVRHLQLKDYRVQFTNEGFRLVRCTIGEGTVPFDEIFEEIGKHQNQLTAVLEPGALEARHVKLFREDWWRGYPAKSAAELAECLLATQKNPLADIEDYRTPWEKNEDSKLVDYELQM